MSTPHLLGRRVCSHSHFAISLLCRKDTLKEGWSFLTTTLDVQSAMEEMQRRQENGAAEESEEMKELEGDMVGKVCLHSR